MTDRKGTQQAKRLTMKVLCRERVEWDLLGFALNVGSLAYYLAGV
ncbi:MAG: hypothetical protein ABSB35_38900 [Bryobacteraceae bacterium]